MTPAFDQPVVTTRRRCLQDEVAGREVSRIDADDRDTVIVVETNHGVAEGVVGNACLQLREVLETVVADIDQIAIADDLPKSAISSRPEPRWNTKVSLPPPPTRKSSPFPPSSLSAPSEP